MYLHKNLMDVEKPQSSEAPKQSHRLYPSLPNIDSQVICALESPSREKHPAAIELRPDSLQGNAQSEDSPSCSDVHLKAQILFLEQQRKELLSINEKWAKEYRTMVRYYKEKIQVLNASQQNDVEKCDERQNTLQKKQQVKLVKVEESLQTKGSDVRADREAEELQVQNNTLTRRGQHQQEEIQRLNKALEEALLTSLPVGVSRETLQNIWKHQAEVYKEDFLKERKDREKLKGKYLELEKKFWKVYDELRLLKSQMTLVLQPQPDHHCPCKNRVKPPNWEACKTPQHQLPRRHTLNAKQ